MFLKTDMDIKSRWGLALLILLSLSILTNGYFLYRHFFYQVPPDPLGRFLVVDKNSQHIRVYNKDGLILEDFPVSTGQNPGNKLIAGDLKTPEGIFPVTSKEDASEWTYDFEDGRGPVTGAYGPLFIRLDVDSNNIFYNSRSKFYFTSEKSFVGIGIHGTHDPSKIGNRASHGCIRLKNEDLLRLQKYVYSGMLTIILPGMPDHQVNQVRNHSNDSLAAKKTPKNKKGKKKKN
jgi:hypothetical protein